MFFLDKPLHARIANRLKLVSLFRVGYRQRILNAVFRIPIIDNKEGLIYHLGVGEPFLIEIFQKLFSVKNYVFLDAGVNFGQTLLKVKAVAPNCVYFGFEPSGLCAYYTSLLINKNKISNAKLIRCALSDQPAVLTLHSHSEGDTRATILSDAVTLDECKFTEIVPAITIDSLDDLLSAEGKDFILKIDVEGAEWMVFQGARRFIDNYRPIIIFENLPATNAQKQSDQYSLGAFIKETNYTLYFLNEELHRLERIEMIENKSDYSATNYLAIPLEDQQLFTSLTGG